MSPPGVQDKVLPRLEVLPVYVHLLQLPVLHQALKHLRLDEIVIDTSNLPPRYLDPVLGQINLLELFESVQARYSGDSVILKSQH